MADNKRRNQDDVEDEIDTLLDELDEVDRRWTQLQIKDELRQFDSLAGRLKEEET